jgi:hypothetical protein
VDAARCWVEQSLERVADQGRLLEDLLLHVMAVIALADEGAGERVLADLAPASRSFSL